MESNLHFVISTTSGDITQDIKVPSDKLDEAINQILAQYSQIGVLKKDVVSATYTLIPASQILLVKCVVQASLVVEALPGDVAKVVAANTTLKRIK